MGWDCPICLHYNYNYRFFCAECKINRPRVSTEGDCTSCDESQYTDEDNVLNLWERQILMSYTTDNRGCRLIFSIAKLLVLILT